MSTFTVTRDISGLVRDLNEKKKTLESRRQIGLKFESLEFFINTQKSNNRLFQANELNLGLLNSCRK